MELRPSGSGPEVIGKKAEPKWENVWGVVLDRESISLSNAEKLSSMALRLSKTIRDRRGYLVDLIITPRGDEDTPIPLKRYETSFAVQIVENAEEFEIAVAGALVQSSQRISSEVAQHIKDQY